MFKMYIFVHLDRFLNVQYGHMYSGPVVAVTIIKWS